MIIEAVLENKAVVVFNPLEKKGSQTYWTGLVAL